MSKIQPISRTEHANKRWLKPNNYHFASSTAAVALTAAEVPAASLAMPLAFLNRSGDWSLAAVLGLAPAQNLFVNAAGRWSAGYIPAAFRAYPFCLGENSAKQTVLCIDEASGLVTDGPEGEAFLDDCGELSATTKQILSFLSGKAWGEASLAKACGALHTAGIIEPWPVAVQENGSERRVADLHRINESSLNALDDITFGHLRRAGAVSVAYAQLLSMGNLQTLGQLAQARVQAEAAARARAEIKPMITLPEDNTIDWDWSKIGR